MQVAFHLRRRSESAPAAALLLFSHDPTELLRLLARIGGTPLPQVFAVADGFLLKLAQPGAEPRGAALRLRALADHLYLPADADLLPALLPDEAADLVRRRGLVFLPGGRVLELHPGQPVPLAAVLGIGELRRTDWQPLPEPGPWAARLTEVTLERPELSPDDLLAGGGEGIGTEAPQPDDASLGSRALGRASFGAGKALAWLGKLIGSKGLAATGVKWMQSGLARDAELSSSVLGKQETSLRDLLSAFRRGDVERALRRALPLGGDPARGATPATGARLPFHNLLYSLANILGGAGGPGGVWVTEADLYRELDREYRKQAELATQRGDYRRAAFIYGKLLNDFRAAAAVLSRGGLHRDAAALYLKPLDDPLAAAREFEAAGELDRALALYRQRGDHVLAGDLLRRAGEEELALEEYVLAAKLVLVAGQGHYQAGELLRTKAGREDLALPYYATGWAERPVGSPVPSAIRLAQWHTRAGNAAQLLALAGEAGEYLSAPGNDGPAAEFYNELARLADQFPRADVQDQLRDLALSGIAGKLRQRAEQGLTTGDMVSALLGLGQAWAPAVVSDAQFAVKQAIRKPRSEVQAPSAFTRITIPARTPLVVAACQASTSGDIFLGLSSGEVFCLRSASGEVLRVWGVPDAILALAATADGTSLVILSNQGDETTWLTSLDTSAMVSMKGTQFLRRAGDAWLCPELAGEGQRFVAGVWNAVDDSGEMRFFQGPDLLPLAHGPLFAEAGLLLPAAAATPTGTDLLAFCPDGFVMCNGHRRDFASRAGMEGGWSPALPDACGLRRPLFSWLHSGPGKVELAGVGEDGVLYATALQYQQGRLTETNTLARSGPLPFLAAAVLRGGLVAGVTRNAVYWLRRTTAGLRTLGKTEVALEKPVACFRYSRYKELLVVCSGGLVVRIPITSSTQV